MKILAISTVSSLLFVVVYLNFNFLKFVVGRIDRYNHDLEDDTDDTDDSPVFGLFSSCSPQYRKVHSSRINSTPDQDTGSDSIRITTSVASTPDTPDIPDLRLKFRSNSVLLTPEKDTVDSVTPEHRKVSHKINQTIYHRFLLYDFIFVYRFH